MLDSTFITKLLLLPDYETYPGFINSSAIILDSNKMFIGVVEPNYFYCDKIYSKSYFGMEKFLIEKKDELNIQSYFDFQDNLFMYVIYGKDINNRIYAFYKDKTAGYYVLPLIEFVDKLWATKSEVTDKQE